MNKILLNGAIVALLVFGFACSSTESANNQEAVVQQDDEKEDVEALESATAEVSEGADEMETNIQDLSSEVDELLSDI